MEIIILMWQTLQKYFIGKFMSPYELHNLGGKSMKTKIIGILVCTLLIATVIPITGAEIIDVSDSDPDLDCFGELIWDDVRPGSIVKSIFYVQNIGGPISELDWEITEWPDWGTWYFLPPGGENLKPNDGAVHVHVFVEVPDQLYADYGGNVTVINKENSSDFDIIPISLSTAVNHNSINSQAFQFFRRCIVRHPWAFPMLRHLLKL